MSRHGLKGTAFLFASCIHRILWLVALLDTLRWKICCCVVWNYKFPQYIGFIAQELVGIELSSGLPGGIKLLSVRSSRRCAKCWRQGCLQVYNFTPPRSNTDWPATKALTRAMFLFDCFFFWRVKFSACCPGHSTHFYAKRPRVLAPQPIFVSNSTYVPKCTSKTGSNVKNKKPKEYPNGNDVMGRFLRTGFVWLRHANNSPNFDPRTILGGFQRIFFKQQLFGRQM